MHAIIMAGGSGTRFWPASRADRPKQFLPFAGGRSLIEATVDRLRDFTGASETWIVTNPPQAAQMTALLDGFPRRQIIVEPEARDTAPCVALAAATIEARDPGATMAVMPADHLIEPAATFHRLLRQAGEIAADDETLVTFGIPPTRPSTGFGYIEVGNELDLPGSEADDAATVHEVLRFREKPDAGTARTFVASGQFLWNSGIFVWTYAGLLRAMRLASPGLAEATEAMLAAARSGDDDALHRAFAAAPKTSVDYAVMERADRVVVVRSEFDWNDLGSFRALSAVGRPDAHGNVALSHDGAQAIIQQCGNCTVYGEGPRTAALFGLQDVIVVHTNDAILVCPKDRSEDLKDLIQTIRDRGRTDLL